MSVFYMNGHNTLIQPIMLFRPRSCLKAKGDLLRTEASEQDSPMCHFLAKCSCASYFF